MALHFFEFFDFFYSVRPEERSVSKEGAKRLEEFIIKFFKTGGVYPPLPTEDAT
jgi:hypothetical protein